MSLRLAASVVVASAIVVLVSCTHKQQGACSIDTDCPTGSFCRDTQCAAVGDGGTVVDGGGTLVCAQPGETCQLDGDCCSPPCNTSGRCAGGGTSSGGTSGGRGSSGASGTSGTSGTSGSSGAGCGQVFAFCTLDTDCCSPLTCGTSGTCQ